MTKSVNGMPVGSKPPARSTRAKAPAKSRAKPGPKPVALNEGNGSMSLGLGWLFARQQLTVTGGPYDGYTPAKHSFGVCVREERVPSSGVDVHLPIRDFGLPADHEAVRKALRDTLEALLLKKDVYVGCMGGFGRTGLFLALLAKAAGVSRPVAYVRNHYCARAVETDAQGRYIADFRVQSLRWWLFKRSWQLWWRGLVA